MPASPIDVIRPAFDHMVAQLFKPFRSSQWVRLAVTGLLAGELGGSGGCGLRVPWLPDSSGDGSNQLAQAVPPAAAAWMFVIVPVVIAIGLGLFVLMMYISSRMRFVLFDSIVNRECSIRRYWRARGEQALRLFVFNLLLTLTTLGGMAIIIGSAAALAFGLGWWRNPRQHIVPIILAGLGFLLLLGIFMIVMTVIAVLAKDFVVPQMALENVNVVEGWRRLQLMISAEKGQYAGYIGMKIVLTIASGIVTAIASFITVLILAIPMALVALIAVFGARAIGLAWNIYTMSAAFTAGILAVIILVAATLLISVPVVVFFPAYSIHFLAARYPALDAQLRRSNL